jgi:hypothetical protein
MKKADAVRYLGGTNTAAARAIGVTVQAVTKMPQELPPRISDRVFAALVRRHLGEEVLLMLARRAAPIEQR